MESGGSLPRWLASRWLKALGPARALERTRAFREVPPATLRINPRAADSGARLGAAGVCLAPGVLPGEWRATAGRPADLAGTGTLYLQDTGSQLVARLCAGPGRRLDACAAPGGKALLMADLAQGEGIVVAAEAQPRRMAALASLARRWAAPNLHLLAADALRPPFRARFSAVLLDAPCSGLGTIARHPDIRWRARPGDLARHAAKQKLLLESVSGHVADGGILVYSVCSDEPEETVEVVRPFLASHPDYRLGPLPDWARGFGGEDGFARTCPERHGGDAFFAALLSRAD
jgi:16S rRNA (cytosine967-C5)-methyltransferase